MTLEQALHARLKRHSAIQKKIGQHIYLGRVPQAGTKKIPDRLILINDFSRNPEYEIAGEIGVTETIVQIDIWARDPDGFDDLRDDEDSIGEAVRQQLSGQRFTEDDLDVKSCTIVRDNFTSARPDDRSDNWLRRRSFDFKVIHTQPAVVAQI